MSELRIAAIIAQETALEAYRDAASPYGFKHRPGPGRPGYGVVSATMSYWHGVDFSKVAKTERDATLRAATHWETDRPAVLWDDDVVYEGVVDDILGRARARIRFDNGDSWDATFPDATVTVISPASRDAAASAATPAAAALALGRPDFGAVLAREGGEAAAKSAAEAEAGRVGARRALGTYKERAIARVHELVPATPVALLPPRSAGEKETKPAAPGWLSGLYARAAEKEERVDDDDGGDRPTAAKASATKRFKPCNCRNSRCLKLYCDCFAAGRFCEESCKCVDCHNDQAHARDRDDAIKATLEKNPKAFRAKVDAEATTHQNGCHCKKTKCLKKYCECFEAGITCGAKCKCADCENYPGSLQLAARRGLYARAAEKEERVAPREAASEAAREAAKKEPAEAKLNELELAAREAAKKEPAEAKPNELELSRVLPREHAIAEARLSERRGVLAASELGEAATLARNFVQNDALQAAPTGEAFFDRCFFKPKGAT
ncbi:DNA-binding transcription factor [Aureococcus anophagefferens]|nr:DNA-binding transcription factor [Aureococcus anophagefferens]